MNIDYSKDNFKVYWTSASNEPVPDSFLCIWSQGNKSSFVNFNDIGSSNSVQDCIEGVLLPSGPSMPDIAGVGYSPSEAVLSECVRRYNACGNGVVSAKQWRDENSGLGILRIEYDNRMVIENLFVITGNSLVPLCRRGSTPMNKVINDWPRDAAVYGGLFVIVVMFVIILWKRFRS